MDIEYALSLEFMKDHAVESARVLESLHPAQVAEFLGEIPPVFVYRTLMAMEIRAASNCLMALTPYKAGAILSRMPLDEASVLIRRFDKESRERVLAALTPENRDPLARLLDFPEGTAGSLMDPKAFSLPEDTPVAEALKRLSHHLDHVVDYVYVVDRNQILRGVATLRALMAAKDDDTVGSLAEFPEKPISPDAEKRAIVEHPAWKVLHELPVTSASGLFLGAIDYRTLRRLENDLELQARPEPAREAGGALGELYWIGLTGLFKGAASIVDAKENDDPHRR